MRNYNNGMFPKKFKLKMHFCLMIFSQDSYEKDKKCRNPLADSVPFTYFAADSVPHMKVKNKGSSLREKIYIYKPFASKV
jgi:hypothetical protein